MSSCTLISARLWLTGPEAPEGGAERLGLVEEEPFWRRDRVQSCIYSEDGEMLKKHGTLEGEKVLVSWWSVKRQPVPRVKG